MNANKQKRSQKKLSLGTHSAQFQNLIKLKDNTFRIRFLVLDNKLKETECIATLKKYTPSEIKRLFGEISESMMMNSHWQVKVSKNTYNDLLTITEIKKQNFTIPKWFVELQEDWQGCKNGEENSEIKKKYLEERELKNPRFKMINQLREIQNRGIKGDFKDTTCVKLFGCTHKELRSHIEKQFQKGWNWSNRGTVWTLDHIKPITSFDLSIKEEQLKSMHYKNLQPLSKDENIAKYNYTITPSLSMIEELFGKN